MPTTASVIPRFAFPLPPGYILDTFLHTGVNKMSKDLMLVGDYAEDYLNKIITN
jgi:hypothetical protein